MSAIEDDELERMPALEIKDGRVPEPVVRRLLGELSVLTHLADIVSLADRNCRFVYVSRVVGGRSEADVLGTSVLDHIPPSTREAFRAAFERCLQTREAETIEADDVKGAWWENRLLPLADGRGEPFVLVTTTDITKRKRAELELSERESRVRLAIESSGVGTFAWDRARDAVSWDEGAQQIFGREADTMPRDLQSGLLYLHADDRSRMEQTIAAAVTSGVLRDGEYRIVRPNGEIRHVLLRGSTRTGSDGQVLGTYGGLIDITERKRLEERLREVQKLDAIGQLTAGIAHNFNNLLGIMLPYLALCRDEVTPEVRLKLSHVEHAGNRAAELIRQLMLFATRQSSAQLESANLVEIAERTVNICRSTFDRRIAITFVAERGLPPVLARPGEVEQVLLNICLNARDALECAPPPEPRIDVEVARGSSDSLVVRVRDNGVGMDELTRSRVFEPFFTTKELGKGTGLGLASAYGIVADHQGRISCESAPGIGTAFQVELPIAPVEAAAPAPDAPSARAARGTETVLVVDDEELLRRVMREVLKRAGYKVLLASDGEQALAILQQQPVDLVLLDRSMPRMSGEQLLARMEELRLQLPVILLTGYAGSAPSTGVSAVLMKPPDLKSLLDTVRRVLDESRSSPPR